MHRTADPSFTDSHPLRVRSNLERNIGFEPILSVWKTAVLTVKHQSRFEDGPNPWSRTKTACSSDRSHTVRPNWEMGCELGFDPNLPASQARVLPLHYKHHKLNSRRWPLSNGHLMGLATYSIAAARRETFIRWRDRRESNPRSSVDSRASCHWTTTPYKMAGQVRFELTSFWLTARRIAG